MPIHADVSDRQTAQIMFKVKNNQLLIFIVRNTRKHFAFSVCGVKLRNNLNESVQTGASSKGGKEIGFS